MSLLETRQLGKFFRTASRAEIRALEDVTLTIPPGSFTALTGPSGSGKTTLLALLGALERPTRGQVLLEGQNLGSFSDIALARVRRRFGFIFQDFALLPHLSVWENITYPLIPRGMTHSRRLQLARSLLERLGLPEKWLARAAELSGGEQQRVAIARALAGDPELLLADEPTSNLDPDTRELLLGVLRDFHSQGKTVIVSSHDPHLLALATAVHSFRSGRQVQETRPGGAASSA